MLSKSPVKASATKIIPRSLHIAHANCIGSLLQGMNIFIFIANMNHYHYKSGIYQIQCSIHLT